MSNPEDSPVLLAQGQFTWTPPEGGETGEFTAALYSTRAVELSASNAYNGLVAGLEWSDRHQAIASGGGFWDASFPRANRDHLLLKATNVLRCQLGLPPHSATGNFPGTEAP
jgi:hypothetical protein